MSGEREMVESNPKSEIGRWVPPLRVTTELDSESGVLLNKISCKLFDSLVKLKASFENNSKGHVSEPQLSIISKHVSCHYDLHQHNALLNASFPVAPGFNLTAAHHLKAQVGQVSMVADLAPSCKLELTSLLPSAALPKATFKFPFGEVSLEENEDQEEEEEEEAAPAAAPKLAFSGIVKAPLLKGICNAHYRDDVLNLRYSFKDEQTTFIPTISLPSNALSINFKRRFTPSSKLSYLYNFDTNYWSAVYKHTVGKEYKVKAGYDSEIRLGWASIWVGDEDGKAKTAPMKTKVQLMLQVPKDDIRSSALMFRVKKRWDI